MSHQGLLLPELPVPVALSAALTFSSQQQSLQNAYASPSRALFCRSSSSESGKPLQPHLAQFGPQTSLLPGPCDLYSNPRVPAAAGVVAALDRGPGPCLLLMLAARLSAEGAQVAAGFTGQQQLEHSAEASPAIALSCACCCLSRGTSWHPHLAQFRPQVSVSPSSKERVAAAGGVVARRVVATSRVAARTQGKVLQRQQ
jgi:hypothetical protein